jgi:hypothetical protein
MVCGYVSPEKPEYYKNNVQRNEVNYDSNKFGEFKKIGF